ncbi:MAG: signal peptide peptidase SppA [Candidatus Hodarchaeales archaeon]|jgi:protease-4
MVWLSPIRRLRNSKRRVLRPKADYFWLSLDFVPPERLVKVSWLRSKIEPPPPPFSIAGFRDILDRLGKDERTKGVILEIQTELPFATTRSLMDHLTSFQEGGKKVITFATHYSLPTYWLASIGSLVTVQLQGYLWISGLYFSQTFMGDFLKNHGFQVEKMAVSPYKSALDELARSDIAPEAEENRQALFESLLEAIVQDIASYRNLSEKQVRQAIDQAPLTPKQALELQLIDQEISPEQIPQSLAKAGKPLRFRPFAVAPRATLIPPKPSMKNLVAIIPVQGVIMDGKSRETPRGFPVPFGGRQAGDHTIVPLIRRALASSRVRAGVLYVDSRGGSATASESIRLGLEEFATRKPLVAYFNNVAASGGYEIATPAHYIVAQPQTITGSIGVLNAKFNFQGFLKQHQMKTTEFKLGDRADWMQPTKPLGDEERQVLTELVFYSYEHFLETVANSRKLDKEHLRENLAGGRVWTGTQAIEHKLIDEIGNLQTAVNRARELASLKPTTGVVTMHPPKKPIAPLSFKETGLSEYVEYVQSLAKTQIWKIEPDLPLGSPFFLH